MYPVYYARSPNDSGEMETVAHHLQKCAELCAGFLGAVGFGQWGRALALLHDFGKISERFSQVLRREAIHINHAAPGAAVAEWMYHRSPARTRRYLASVIASHHSRLRYVDIRLLPGLIEGGGSRLDSEGYCYSLYGQEEFMAAAALWKKDFARPALPSPPDFSDAEDELLAEMLFARFLFSGLVDADYSSSAMHFNSAYLVESTGPALDAADALERLRAVQSEKRQGSTSAPGINRLRDRLFEDCLAAAEDEPGIFTLTAPTGLGKTLSLFAFAARHCQRYGKRRIVLVLPYLSIIDQNVKDYRKIVPELLEIHSGADLDEGARLLSARWAAPCVVTTSVGFFEPLFSNRPVDCRHLHQLAGSVIVLDEAQALPPRLLDATLRTLKLLCDGYGCTVLLSTATQPAFEFRPGLEWKPREIVPDTRALFAATRRVEYSWRIDSHLSFEELAQEAAEEKQVCVIVNLRRHALRFYRLLSEKGNGAYLLTSDLCPAHRLALISEISGRLKRGERVALVATQCIEAGVDLDFAALYRALAPLHSIIQAAGRCNRGGSMELGRVTVFLPEDEGYPDESYKNAAELVRVLLSRHPIDCSDPSHIREYYSLLYPFGEGDRPALRAAIESEDFDAVCGAYRIIDNAGVQVIVPYEGELELFRSVRDIYDAEGLSPRLLKLAQPITVSTYDRKGAEGRCQRLCFRSPERRGEELPTGCYLLGDPSGYDGQMGLQLCGQAAESIF